MSGHYVTCMICIFFVKITIAQVNFTGSDLPIILIDTDDQIIPDEPKIMATMKVINNRNGNRNNLNDIPAEYDGRIGIETRGASSQTFPKKGYGLETRNADGSNRNVELFGMPSENDWVLHGPFSDKSLIRNALAYKLARSVMPYTTRTQFCEVLINNEYQGVYLFIEKIKRDKNRVSINKLKLDENAGDSLTGGYIIKIDKGVGGNQGGWISEYPPLPGAWQRTVYQYHYPKAEDITIQQRNYIQQFITDFEHAMASENFADTLVGYRQYLDSQTFVDFILLNEMCKNVDAYRISTYLSKDKDSVDPLMKAGPVWDFNLGFGNVDFCAGPQVEGWILDYNSVCPDDNYLVPFWWKRLLEDDSFGKKLVNRWRSLRQNEWSDDQLLNSITQLNMEVQEAQSRNFSQWSILDQYVWPNAFVGNTYPAEIRQLRSWLTGRVAWMDKFIEQLNRHRGPPPEILQLEVFPNPFSEQINFRIFTQPGENVNLCIYNALSQRIFTQELVVPESGIEQLEWMPLDNTTGLFYYVIKTDRKKVTKGIILRR